MTVDLVPVFSDADAFRKACDDARRRGDMVGLVPTMGALHAGHLALVDEARRRCSFVAVSIFVNPTQFGPNEDLANYPRTFASDHEGCTRVGASCIFAPSAEAMYPPGDRTRVRVDEISGTLCGPSRPGHFEGVATIVTKLFVVTGACTAVFGRKDYQQLKVIESLARDLLLPVEVVGFPTVREPDGLAMSSRNRYLSENDRVRAGRIPKGLTDAWRVFEEGERSADALRACVHAQIDGVVDSVDYVDVADPDTLQVFGARERVPDRVLLAVALRVGPARLIDNLVLGEDPPPLRGDSA